MSKKRDCESGDRESPSDGPSRKRQHCTEEEVPSINDRILEALHTQNCLLKSIDDSVKSQAAAQNELLREALTAQNELLRESISAQNDLLRSMDARLGRMEAQGGEGSSNHPSNNPSPSLCQQQHAVVGSWKFIETNVSRQRKAKILLFDNPSMFFGRIDETQQGKGHKLLGEQYYQNKSPSSRLGAQSGSRPDFFTPLWSFPPTRNLLPALVFNAKPELALKTGTYLLKIRYNCSNPPPGSGSNAAIKQDAGVIVGEVDFSSKGFVMAQGADWDKLLNNQKQTQLPYSNVGARGQQPVWNRRKISEPWEDGDELKITIDTNENTILFRKSSTPEKSFRNVLAFTNNLDHPESLPVFAYCGWESSPQRGMTPEQQPNVKLTIIP